MAALGTPGDIPYSLLGHRLPYSYANDEKFVRGNVVEKMTSNMILD